MNTAKYTVYVPRHDSLGHPLPHLATAAHHYLAYGPVKVTKSYIDSNKMLMTPDRKRIPHDLLIAFGEDNPEMDSHMKQLAAYVGEVANHPHIDLTKEGQKIDHWTVRNVQHQPGVPGR